MVAPKIKFKRELGDILYNNDIKHEIRHHTIVIPLEQNMARLVSLGHEQFKKIDIKEKTRRELISIAKSNLTKHLETAKLLGEEHPPIGHKKYYLLIHERDHELKKQGKEHDFLPKYFEIQIKLRK